MTTGAAVSEEIPGLEKCIRLFVPSAAKNVKFLSSRQKASQFTAENAMQKRKDTDFLQ